MSDRIVPVPEAFAATATMDARKVAEEQRLATEHPEMHWRAIGERLEWSRPFTRVKDTSFDVADFRIRWYADGQLNVAVNCLDRHLAERGEKTAIVWEGDDPATPPRRISYRELHGMVCRLANALTALGIDKGDRVTLYLPMIPETAAAMLACARIGAVHSVVFAGFSADSIASRIADCGSKLVITADEGRRGGRTIPLKANVDAALARPGTSSVETVLVVRHTG